MGRHAIPCCALLLSSFSQSALAAGGAHVVDDAAIEAPGTCHLENWISAGADGATLLNLGPACTAAALPNIELGGFLTHQWRDNITETDGGLGLKLLLRNEDRGWGLALSTGAGFSAKRSRMESASIIVPLTIPVSSAVRVNINAGWQWTRAERHSLFTGGQAEIVLTPRLGLMIEGFTRSKGKAGGQSGVRWTIDHERIDVDLLMGRYVDGATRNAVTLGITIRR